MSRSSVPRVSGVVRGARTGLAGVCVVLALLVVVGAALLAASAKADGVVSDNVLVGDGHVVEGDAGSVDMVFEFQRLDVGLVLAKQVEVYTTDSTAQAGADYVPVHTFVRFPAVGLIGFSNQVQYLRVPVLGDLLPEGPEAFQLIFPHESASGYVFGVIDDTPDPPAPPGRIGEAGTLPQLLLSRAADGGLPNAPATEPVLSWDARTARYAAYTSAATNITAGTDGKRNVFLVKRGGAPGIFGTPWEYGSTTLASSGLGGQPANGDSWSPALGGWVLIDAARGPACLAFVSSASNLVAGDGNRQADVFIRAVRGGRLSRIPSPRGRAASQVAVSGDCRTQAIVAGGALYIHRAGQRLRKLSGGPVTSPRLTYNGVAVSYAKGPVVYAQRIDGKRRAIGRGSRPAPDEGRQSSDPKGLIRAVSYERNGSVYLTRVGGHERLISPGSAPSTTAGADQLMYAQGPWIWLYATSNNFGKREPQGYCPLGQGRAMTPYTSARGNYVAFACTGGASYLSYIGPK